ncbi:MAG: sulfotransferase domain-containing protein [Elainellaceae cyanobacterium]
MLNESFTEKVGFAVGTGRCGTKFMGQVVALEPNVSSVHERNPLNETFHRYCNWYGLPVDSEGFLSAKELEIRQDLSNHMFSFEASAHLSLSIRELYDRFGAKFILLVRSPERVVNSYLRKGWYSQPAVRTNPNLAPSFQSSCPYFYYFLGRIMPSGEEFLRWNQMSRVGKLGWYWNTLNAKVLEQFETLPETHYRIEKLEDLTYDRYLSLAQFLGIQSSISQTTYNELVHRPPNAKSGVPTIATWNASERSEFETEVKPMAEKMGYEYKVNHLPIPHPQPDKPRKLTWIKRQYWKLRFSGAEIDASKQDKSLIK